MQYSEDRDVLLLNSDTVVTKGWMDKIIACAYSSPEIGTVTPMSNAATLCSVPVICVDNKIPENLSIDEYAELVERCSLKKYPRITAAVGFCMYIKRAVINEVGLFDAETLTNVDMVRKMTSVIGRNSSDIFMLCVIILLFIIKEPFHFYPKKRNA